MSKVNILWNFANHLASACSAIMLGFMVYVRSGSNFQYTYAHTYINTNYTILPLAEMNSSLL